ncbi:MAG: hypothetical protein AAFP16_19185 [Pseudomonadota bacterium]
MSLITPEDEESRAEELLTDVQDSLRDLRSAFRALKERADAGEVLKNTEIKARFSELSTTLVNCHRLEMNLAEVRSKRSCIAQGGFALDLDAARAEVRCALGRLRPCCGAGEISE